LAESDIRLFGVKWPNKVGDALNFWGDWAARGKAFKSSGGIQFSGQSIARDIRLIVESIKSYYLLAYASFEETEAPAELKVEFRVKGKPDYRIFASRKAPSVRRSPAQ